MDSETATNNADILLREIPNVKASNANQVVPKLPVKEELKTLHISERAQEQILETLKYIHGPDFALSDVSAYKDKDSKFMKKYWVERGNLIVKGGCDFSQNADGPTDEGERLKLFGLLRLESYGFHKNHCLEAFEYCNGDIEDALYLLYSKYFHMKSSKEMEHGLSEKDLLDMRTDEKSSLESIYGEVFSEKVKNTVWLVNLKLIYLVNKFHKKELTNKRAEATVKKKALCRGFLAGNCKFGSKCRFSHAMEVEEKNINAHIEDFNFELEIRFPKNTKYPYEPPLLFLRTTAVIPPVTCLHISARLYQEAEILAEDGIPSVYSLIELLQNEEDILNHLEKPLKFPDKNEPLIPKESSQIVKNRPSHYKKGTTNRDNVKDISGEEMVNLDARLADDFMAKTRNASYIKMLGIRRNLPAWNSMQEILQTLQANQVLVISGETGCGKSTQVPQYVLDDWLANYGTDTRHVEIICTQPRRISALGVAERVAQERVEKIGDSVGYQIRLESKLSRRTRLTFCTTGILLRKLENEPNLPNVTHVIVDEVHERSVESDFLLQILRELMEVRSDLKVILMSATLNADLFSDYFGGTPVIDIPGRTFPVEQYFLEDILETMDCVLEENSQYMRRLRDNEDIDKLMESCKIRAEHSMPKDNVKDENLSLEQLLARYGDYSAKTCKQLYLLDPEQINFELIEHILLWIVNSDNKKLRKGSILIFLPGIAEITTLYDQLNNHSVFTPRKGKFVLVPLHSSLTSEEQSLVFRTPKEGARKIILSTNIAETSVTIDDCVFVIDSGKMKEKHFDSNRNMESLETVWVTRANAMQRKGRAGRVTSGICVHMYTRHRFTHHFLGQPVPEIQRIPLEQLILNIKVLPIFASRGVNQVLDAILEPPSLENRDAAILRLQHVGALDKQNDLTPLGHHLAALPVDVRIGKLMLYGAIFCCVDAALTMAACLSHKSPFVAPFGKKDLANDKKRKFALGNSDQLTILVAYKKWKAESAKSRAAGYNFANENYLSVKTMEMLADIKHQLLELLVSIGFIPVNIDRRHKSGRDEVLTITGPEFNKNGENIRLLSSVICAALYPNVVKLMTAETSYQKSMVGAIPKATESKNLRFRTKDDWVFMHPSSVNHQEKSFSSPYLVYQEKVKTKKIYIRDTCMIPVIPLVLFSGFDVEISVHSGNTYIVLEDGWIMFRVEEHKIAEMIKTIRTELLDLLEEKIADPLLNLVHHDKGEKIIATILNLITNE